MSNTPRNPRPNRDTVNTTKFIYLALILALLFHWMLLLIVAVDVRMLRKEISRSLMVIQWAPPSPSSLPSPGDAQ